MSQQLMSDGSPTPNSRLPRPSAVALLQDYRRPKDVDVDREPLRGQVSMIIEAILAGNSPDEADLRERLRRHVTRNPGRPERALLGHLISMPGREDEAG